MEVTITKLKTLRIPSIKNIVRSFKPKIKVLFLDIDGVVNSKEYLESRRAEYERTRIPMEKESMIDPYAAHLVRNIVESTDCKVVLSSTWRLYPDDRDLVRERVVEFMSITPRMPRSGGVESMERGYEIQAWLDDHPEVEDYAILDDDSDMLPHQIPHFFKTTWEEGLTDEIARDVIRYLNHW